MTNARRELVNYHYLERTEGRYRVVEQAPSRAPIERQEIPEWRPSGCLSSWRGEHDFLHHRPVGRSKPFGEADRGEDATAVTAPNP